MKHTEKRRPFPRGESAPARAIIAALHRGLAGLGEEAGESAESGGAQETNVPRREKPSRSADTAGKNHE